jgi:LysR family glycine cleavage system transcriptional activator
MSKTHDAHRRRLPPLNPLRAFEAAARRMSFTLAADELGVTQGAISRSVKALEEHLGFPLFDRAGAGWALKEGGAESAAALTDAFADIQQATAILVGRQAHAVLSVCGYTTFLTRWLIPRLPDFQRRYPDIELRLVSANDRVNPERGRHDIRIRYGRGRWKNQESVLLFRDELRPVCSPALLDPGKRPYHPDVLKEHVLLQVNARPEDWSAWFDAAGSKDSAHNRRLNFEELSIAYQCAIAGAGVALGHRAYVAAELADAQLFEPFDTVLRRDYGYYLTYAASRKEVRKIRAFRDWVIDAISGPSRNGIG